MMNRREVVAGAGATIGLAALAPELNASGALRSGYLMREDGMKLRTSEHRYQTGGGQFDLYSARPSGLDDRLGAILVFPGWDGLNAPVKDKVHQVASLGYQAVGIDVYGTGVRGDPFGDNSHLMNPLMEDRALLRDRVLAAFAAVKKLEGVDDRRIGAIGYCFGGLCALDLARAVPDGLEGVVSFHGVLKPTGLREAEPIRTSVLVETGSIDPTVPMEDVQAFCKEMTSREADWQVHIHGNTMHAFTFKGLAMPEIGLAYNEAADHRSWRSMCLFFEDLFEKTKSY